MISIISRSVGLNTHGPSAISGIGQTMHNPFALLIVSAHPDRSGTRIYARSGESRSADPDLGVIAVPTSIRTGPAGLVTHRAHKPHPMRHKTAIHRRNPQKQKSLEAMNNNRTHSTLCVTGHATRPLVLGHRFIGLRQDWGGASYPKSPPDAPPDFKPSPQPTETKKLITQ
jgi:hypothetical protein